MKTPLTLVIAVVVLVGAGCRGLSSWGKASTWQCDDNCVVLSGTSVPQPQLNNIIKLLQNDKFPQNYRVGVWKNGKRNPTTLGKMQISKAEMATDDANAKRTGLTAITYRVGNCDRPKGSCDPRTNCNPFMKDGKELAEQICKILKSI